MTQKCVNKARFTDIRTAYDGDADVFVLILILNGFKACDDLIEHVSDTKPLLGGNADGCSNAEGIEIIDGILKLGMIDLV